MTRKDIIEFVRAEICPQVSLNKVGSIAFFSFNFRETIALIESWRRKNNFPQHMTATVENGFLFINGKPAGRITAAPQHFYENDTYEEKILATQEYFQD